MTSQDTKLQGKLLLDRFIADSQGQGRVLVHGLKVTVPAVTGTQVAPNGVTGAIGPADSSEPVPSGYPDLLTKPWRVG